MTIRLQDIAAAILQGFRIAIADRNSERISENEAGKYSPNPVAYFY